MTIAAVTSAHPVAEVLRARAATESKPGERDDAFRVGLAIEGGAMRGVVSAGMTAALEQLGLQDAFDAIYGSSAGAINAAYFIAGRAALCASSYWEEMTTRGFIDWFRIFRGRPVLSLDFVLDDVAEEEKPLDWDAVLASPVELHVVAASVRTLKAVELARMQTKQELKDALRASSQVPLLAGPPLARGDDLLLDASLFASIPFRFALDGGCTHVLALRTRPVGVLRGTPSFVERHVIARRLGRVSPGLREAFLRRAEQYKREIDELMRRSEAADEAPHVLAIAPRQVSVRQAERDPGRMRDGAREGIEAVYRALAGEEPQVINVLRAYPRP